MANILLPTNNINLQSSGINANVKKDYRTNLMNLSGSVSSNPKFLNSNLNFGQLGSVQEIKTHTTDTNLPLKINPANELKFLEQASKVIKAYADKVVESENNARLNNAGADFERKLNEINQDYKNKKGQNALDSFKEYQSKINNLKQEYSKIFDYNSDYKNKWGEVQETLSNRARMEGSNWHNNQVQKVEGDALESKLYSAIDTYLLNYGSPNENAYENEIDKALKSVAEWNGVNPNSEEYGLLRKKVMGDSVKALYTKALAVSETTGDFSKPAMIIDKHIKDINAKDLLKIQADFIKSQYAFREHQENKRLQKEISNLKEINKRFEPLSPAEYSVAVEETTNKILPQIVVSKVNTLNAQIKEIEDVLAKTQDKEYAKGLNGELSRLKEQKKKMETDKDYANQISLLEAKSLAQEFVLNQEAKKKQLSTFEGKANQGVQNFTMLCMKEGIDNPKEIIELAKKKMPTLYQNLSLEWGEKKIQEVFYDTYDSLNGRSTPIEAQSLVQMNGKELKLWADKNGDGILANAFAKTGIYPNTQQRNEIENKIKNYLSKDKTETIDTYAENATKSILEKRASSTKSNNPVVFYAMKQKVKEQIERYERNYGEIKDPLVLNMFITNLKSDDVFISGVEDLKEKSKDKFEKIKDKVKDSFVGESDGTIANAITNAMMQAYEKTGEAFTVEDAVSIIVKNRLNIKEPEMDRSVPLW